MGVKITFNSIKKICLHANLVRQLNIFTNAVRDYSGTITCDVTLESTGEVIPFTASPDDEYDYGRDLYEQLNTTDLSSVTPYTDADRLAQDEKDVVHNETLC